MKIPQNELNVLLQDCRTMFDLLPEARKKDESNPVRFEPLIMYSQKYGNFKWLTYHTVVYIGGRFANPTNKLAIIFRPQELKVAGEPDGDWLLWFNKVLPGNDKSWHTIKPENDEVIEPVI